METDPLLLIFLKAPLPGRVKTRLASTLGAGAACEAYREMAQATCRSVLRLGAVRIVACYSPLPEFPDLAWAGQQGLETWDQGDGGLGDRMARAFDRAFEEGARRVAAIGADSPGLPIEWISRGFEKLGDSDLVLGPSEDGGFYLVGLRRPPGRLFDGIPWSSGEELARTREKARKLGLSVRLLPRYYDIDTADDLRRWRPDLAARKRPGG